MEPSDVVDGFFEQQSTADPAERARLLELVITNTAEFHGLQVHLVGRTQIEAEPIDASRLVRTSRVQRRGQWIRWEWEYRRSDGETERAADGTAYVGTAIGLLADDDRLQLIVPFLGLRP